MSKLLLGAEKFKCRLVEIASGAQESLLVQAMTFEGDGAGRWLIDTMQSSPAKYKLLLIDSYSKVVINDHFVLSLKYIFDNGFRAEVKATKAMIKEAKQNGIDVRFTNPVGFFGQRYPLRNHKKMVVADGKISYLGGINFSDHNFAWHDMMVEIEDEKVGKYLTEDFKKTWVGENQSRKVEFTNGQLYFLNGRKSQLLYDNFFEHLRTAKNTIQVISPYVSEPLFSVLRRASNKGIHVTIISPKENNKSIFKSLIIAEHKKGYFDLKEFEGMSHMKAILIDNEKLIFGSSNYDLISYYFEQEVVMISNEQSLISQFQSEVLSQVRTPAVVTTSFFDTWKTYVLMKTLDFFGKFASSTFLRPF